MSQALKVAYVEESPEILRIRQIFGVEGKELRERLRALAEAAFEEYRIEMSGLRSISTMREQRELRLYLLYEHLGSFGEPTEAQIGELFQMTRRQVGTLITGTWARFRPELEKRQQKVIKAALEKGEWLKEDKVVRVELPDTLAGYVEDRLAEKNTPSISKVSGMTRMYDIDRQTAEVLCAELGIATEGIIPAKKKAKGKGD